MFFSDFSFIIPPSHRTPLSFQICKKTPVISQVTGVLHFIFYKCEYDNIFPPQMLNSLLKLIQRSFFMICRNCNYILSGNEQFCPNCGFSLNNTADQSRPPSIFTSEKDRDNDEIKQPANRIFLSPDENISYEEGSKKGKKGNYYLGTAPHRSISDCGGFNARSLRRLHNVL